MSIAKLDKLNQQLEIERNGLKCIKFDLEKKEKCIENIQNDIELERWRLKHPILQLFMTHIEVMGISLICLTYDNQNFCLYHNYLYPCEISGCFHCLFQRRIQTIQWVCRGPLKRMYSKYNTYSLSLFPTLEEDIRLLEIYHELQIDYSTSVLRGRAIYYSEENAKYLKRIDGIDQFDPECTLSFNIAQNDFCIITVHPKVP